jgi:outer membrane receptor for monomeric catechols
VQLPQISVQGGDSQSGYQAIVPALSKLTQPLLDTPESISVIPRQLMEDQAVTAVRDALRDVPGVSLAAGEAGPRATASHCEASAHATTSTSTACATSAVTTAIRSTCNRSKY